MEEIEYVYGTAGRVINVDNFNKEDNKKILKVIPKGLYTDETNVENYFRNLWSSMGVLLIDTSNDHIEEPITTRRSRRSGRSAGVGVIQQIELNTPDVEPFSEEDLEILRTIQNLENE